MPLTLHARIVCDGRPSGLACKFRALADVECSLEYDHDGRTVVGVRVSPAGLARLQWTATPAGLYRCDECSGLWDTIAP